MKENKVIFIIAILIVIATIVFAAVYVSKSKNKEQNKVNSEANIKVYRLYEKEDNKEEHVYRQCNVPANNLSELVQEFNRSYALTDSDKLTGKSITGNYKIIYNDRFIAFDNSKDNMVYLGETNTLYTFKSSMYQKVISYCE